MGKKNQKIDKELKTLEEKKTLKQYQIINKLRKYEQKIMIYVPFSYKESNLNIFLYTWYYKDYKTKNTCK